MNNDTQLLQEYAETGSEAAFAILVDRHLNMVWSTARRITGDDELAKDVAQTVFADFARKARWLVGHVSPIAWLYKASSLAARKMYRTNRRRFCRERQAMHPIEGINATSTDDPHIELLLPILDEAMASLGNAERDAITLRFFGHQTFTRIGSTQGISDDAAQKRVSRAVDRLRTHFARRGFKVSAGGISAALSNAMLNAAPVGLAQSITTSSVAAGVGCATSSLSTTYSYIQTQIAIMKTPLLVTAAAAFLVVTPLVLQQLSINSARAELAAIQRSLLTAASSESSVSPGGIDPRELAQLRNNRNELALLRTEAERLRQAQDPALLAGLKEARAATKVAQAAASEVAEEIEAEEVRRVTINVGKNLGLGARIFAVDHSGNFPTKFEEMKEALSTVNDTAFERFEFYPQPRQVLETEPQLFLFRERQPRRFGGRWERSYCRSDGSVVTLTSDTSDFSAKEIAADGVAKPVQPDGTAVRPDAEPEPKH